MTMKSVLQSETKLPLWQNKTHIEFHYTAAPDSAHCYFIKSVLLWYERSCL
jgi:hypothetical protein